MIATLLSRLLPAVAHDPFHTVDDRLESARRDFVDALEGVAPSDAWQLLDAIADATSMHELWHLRVEVFRRVATAFDQHEADERLAQLNRHFPTRSPRSGFGSL
jgi:hypothetical protein